MRTELIHAESLAQRTHPLRVGYCYPGDNLLAGLPSPRLWSTTLSQITESPVP